MSVTECYVILSRLNWVGCHFIIFLGVSSNGPVLQTLVVRVLTSFLLFRRSLSIETVRPLPLQ